MATDYDYLFKTVLVGDSGVGKTSLLLRYADNTFTSNHITTIGVDFKIKTLDTATDGRVKMQLWDTAGQDRFKSVVSSFYRGAHGLIIVYDVSDIESFEHVREWFKEAEKYSDTCTFLLVGNKTDLTTERVVTFDAAQALANELGVPYIETSAKDTINVEQAFTSMISSMVEVFKVNPALKNKPKGVPIGRGRDVHSGGGGIWPCSC